MNFISDFHLLLLFLFYHNPGIGIFVQPEITILLLFVCFLGKKKNVAFNKIKWANNKQQQQKKSKIVVYRKANFRNKQKNMWKTNHFSVAFADNIIFDFDFDLIRIMKINWLKVCWASFICYLNKWESNHWIFFFNLDWSDQSINQSIGSIDWLNDDDEKIFKCLSNFFVVVVWFHFQCWTRNNNNNILILCQFLVST